MSEENRCVGVEDGSHYIYSEDGEPTGYFYDVPEEKEKETDDGRE